MGVAVFVGAGMGMSDAVGSPVGSGVCSGSVDSGVIVGSSETLRVAVGLILGVGSPDRLSDRFNRFPLSPE